MSGAGWHITKKVTVRIRIPATSSCTELNRKNLGVRSANPEGSLVSGQRGSAACKFAFEVAMVRTSMEILPQPHLRVVTNPD
jgi:hypothetical protein